MLLFLLGFLAHGRLGNWGRLALCTGLMTLAGAAHPDTLVVGSKRFTESYILGEVVRQVLVDAGTPIDATVGPIIGRALRNVGV